MYNKCITVENYYLRIIIYNPDALLNSCPNMLNPYKSICYCLNFRFILLFFYCMYFFTDEILLAFLSYGIEVHISVSGLSACAYKRIDHNRRVWRGILELAHGAPCPVGQLHARGIG